MFFGDQRIAQFIRFVIILDDRARQRCSLGDGKPAGEFTRGDVVHRNIEGDYLDFADQLFAHIEAADEMGWNADIRQPDHQIFRNPVVQDAFARDGSLAVEGVGVILEILDKRARFRALVEYFCLAFVYSFAARHGL